MNALSETFSAEWKFTTELGNLWVKSWFNFVRLFLQGRRDVVYVAVS